MATARVTNIKPVEDKVAQPSLADRAYHIILDQILRGRLPVGSALSRRNLADQLQMSIVPVAQALQRLEIEGLLESRPRAGTRVRVPSADEILSRFELRQALECQSARLCAARMTYQERMELRRLAANLDALDAGGNPNCDEDRAFAISSYHTDLHKKIAEYARSEVLRAEIDKSHVLVFNWLYDTTMRVRTLPPNFHADLISAIVEGNPQTAEHVMREHIMYGLASTQLAIAPLQGKKWRLKA